MSATPIHDALVVERAGRDAREFVRAGLAAYVSSNAVSARYPVPCPTCGAEPFQPCRTRKTRRVTDTHLGRIG